MAYVEIKSITKSFDEKKVLNQVSFKIRSCSTRIGDY